eukprot:TRINITY_DN302_c0_g1_i1.p1 TRINITY_DN302_c0_g1~~TRINITY_DN302_c0_g1_i1.p1  ORF type:complete len:130 (+),score=13.73 TRINITY_DN302_c0_g1_i1:95-484(+)
MVLLPLVLYLSVPEVLLFTVMTPLYIALLNDLIARQFTPRYLLVAVVAIVGAVAIRYQGINEDFVIGLLLVQAANLCFAAGQVSYKRLMASSKLPQRAVFGWFFMAHLLFPAYVLPCLVTPTNYPCTLR